MGYAESVWERAMQVQEVVFRAMAGESIGFGRPTFGRECADDAPVAGAV